MLALSQDAQQNRPVEAREHIRRFHELFFTLSPDKNAIESNVQRALYLSDESAIGYYRNLQEKGYFNRMIAGNISQTLTVDSIGGNFDSYPYEMRAYCRQHIIRSSSVTERSLVTTCRLRNVTRSDNNPQGFLIVLPSSKTGTSDSMKDNGLKKVFQSFRTGKDRHIAKLRRRWQRLSYRQQRVIILYLLGLFAAIDLAYIVGGFCGTDKFPIEVRHLQRVALPRTDSIQPFKNNVSNDTIR